MSDIVVAFIGEFRIPSISRQNARVGDERSTGSRLMDAPAFHRLYMRGDPDDDKPVKEVTWHEKLVS
jgi:hypothetical protein